MHGPRKRKKKVCALAGHQPCSGGRFGSLRIAAQQRFTWTASKSALPLPFNSPNYFYLICVCECVFGCSVSLPSRCVCLNFIFLPDFKACGKIGGGLFLAAASAYNFRKVFHSCFFLFFSFFGDVALKQLLPLFFVVFLFFFPFQRTLHQSKSVAWHKLSERVDPRLSPGRSQLWLLFVLFFNPLEEVTTKYLPKFSSNTVESWAFFFLGRITRSSF